MVVVFDLFGTLLDIASLRTAAAAVCDAPDAFVATWREKQIAYAFASAIMDRYGVRTKTEAVELALRHLAGQPMTREEALSMRGAGAIGEIPADTAPLAAA